MKVLVNMLKKRLFYIFYSKRFKYFSKSSVFFNPDIIEGHKYIKIEDKVVFQTLAWLLALKQDNVEPEIIIKEGTIIGRFSHLVALRRIIIEKNVLIADKVYISDNIHEYKNINIPIKNQKILYKADVIIGENSWIGENVSILGAKIGKHCIIGANAVVTQDIPDFSIAVGIPASVIKKFNHSKHIWEPVDVKR